MANWAMSGHLRSVAADRLPGGEEAFGTKSGLAAALPQHVHEGKYVVEPMA